MSDFHFACPKCHHHDCEIGEIRAASGFWSKVFDMRNRQLTMGTRCRYTELYAADSSTLGNIFDLFTQ